MNLRSVCSSLCALLAGLGVSLRAEPAGPLDDLRTQAGAARLGRPLGPTPRTIALADSATSVLCFEGEIRTVTAPGCFTTPQEPGDCSSHASQYFVQYLFPDVQAPHQVVALGFVSNDMETLFPSAGVIPISYKKPARDGAFDLVIFDRCAPAAEDALPLANTFFIGDVPPPWKVADLPPMEDTLIRNPATGEMMKGAAKAASVRVKIRALSKLKGAAIS